MATQDTEATTFVDPLSNSSKASIVTPPSTNSSSKKILKSIYKVEKSIENIYTHGKALVSNDEQFLVCCCSDKIKIVDISSGQVVKILSTEETSQTGATFDVLCLAPNNNDLFASSNMTMRVYQWSLADGTLTRTFRAHDVPILCMTVDSTSSLLATGGSSDQTIKVFDIKGGYTTHLFKGHGGTINTLAFHPDPNKLILVSGSDDLTLRVWHLVKKSSRVLKKHYSTPTAIDFTKDGKYLISAGRDKVVVVWDIEKCQDVKTIPVYDAIESMIVLPKATHEDLKTCFVVGGESGVIFIVDQESGQKLYEEKLEGPFAKSIQQLLYCQKSQILIKVTVDHNFIFYNLDIKTTKGKLQTNVLTRSKLFVGFNDEIIDIKYLTKEQNMISVATNSDQIRIFDLNNNGCKILSGHSDIVLSIDVSVFANLLASSSKDHTIKLWDTASLECVASCVGHMEAVSCIAFSKNNRKGQTNVFLVSGSKDRTLKLWPIARTGAQVTVGRSLTVLAHDKDINALTVSPNDKLIATASQDKLIKLWNANDLSLYGTLKGHRRGIWCVEFSPIEQAIVSSSADMLIKIWSITDQQCLKTFEGHTSSVLRVSFITAGTQLLSTGSDGTMKLWNIKTGDAVNTFDAHNDRVWSLAISNDEDRVVTGAGDSVIHIWKDYTLLQQEEDKQKTEQTILKEQELLNAIHNKQYLRAFKAAFALEQPHRILTLIEEMMAETEFENQLESLIASLSLNDIEKLLTYIRDWNTNSKHSGAAQIILQFILRNFRPSQLQEKKSLKKVFESMIPYTDKHLQRIDKLLEKSYILDYTIQRQNLIIGQGNLTQEIMGNNIQVRPLSKSSTRSYSDPAQTHNDNMDVQHENGEAANGEVDGIDGNNSMDENPPQESDEDNFFEEPISPPKPKKQKKAQQPETNGTAKAVSKKEALKQKLLKKKK